MIDLVIGDKKHTHISSSITKFSIGQSFIINVGNLIFLSQCVRPSFNGNKGYEVEMSTEKQKPRYAILAVFSRHNWGIFLRGISRPHLF
jgi:hypothetical protein